MRKCFWVLAVTLAPLLSMAVLALPAWADEVVIGYLSRPAPRPPLLATLLEPPADEGVQGARLGIADNTTTGRFLGQTFRLIEQRLAEDGDVPAALAALAEQGARLVVADLDPDGLDAALSTPGAERLHLINAGAADDRFRGADCRRNLLHTLPARAMRTDALTQFLVVKRWTRWLLIQGPRPADALFVAALRRSAQRFGAKIVAEKPWDGESDMRRSAETEVPVLTQGIDYDVLIVADEAGDFGDYLLYNTRDPRPVAGTQGLTPAAWHWGLERWGAGQLQSRFQAQAHRTMTDRDYAAWLAVRAVGEAATRGRSADPAALIAALNDPAFSVGGFKGAPLSFRPWDGQMRQPVFLTHPNAIVSISPQEGFLHPTSEMDTLGYDAPETLCQRRP